MGGLSIIYQDVDSLSHRYQLSCNAQGYLIVAAWHPLPPSPVPIPVPIPCTMFSLLQTFEHNVNVGADEKHRSNLYIILKNLGTGRPPIARVRVWVRVIIRPRHRLPTYI